MTFLDLGILNDVLDAFEAATFGWVFTLFPIGRRLFFLLGSLELSWSGIRFALSHHEGGLFGFFELAVRKFLYLGFVYWLLEASPALLPMIINATLMAQAGLFMIVLSFAAMAAIIVVTLIESYLAIGATFVLLAFAASRWTAAIAQGALTNVLRIGVKLYVLYLVSGVVTGLVVERCETSVSGDW